jgi:cobalamin biosynthesis Mg chelatase CobN
VHPGYYCAQNGTDAVALQKVVGEVNPEGHPKAGQATTLATQCACSKYEGYEERDGQCLKPGEISKIEEAKANATQNKSNEAVQNASANNSNTSENSSQNQSVKEGGDGFIPADLLTVPEAKANETQKEEVVANAGFDIWSMVGGIIIVSIVGAVIIGIIVAIGLYGAKHFRRKGL